MSSCGQLLQQCDLLPDLFENPFTNLAPLKNIVYSAVQTIREISMTKDEQPIRIFKSDFLEFFSHISPVTVLIIWTPAAIVPLLFALMKMPREMSPAFILVGVVIGLFLWSLSEYSLHRFVFHYKARTKRQERISFLFHGVHHEQPMVKTRLVMPPPVSIVIGFLFYALFRLVFGAISGAPWLANSVFAGFAFGYVTYDMLHYSTHHFQLRSKTLKAVRSHHMKHHFRTPDMRFGVTSTFWDHVFGTEPKE